MLELHDNEFDLISSFVEKTTGVILNKDKSYLVQHRLMPIVQADGLESFRALYDTLCTHKDSELLEKVVDAITTHETSFFRDKHPFDCFHDVLLPKIYQQKSSGGRLSSPIRIWCAAASTGQEPYSLAMLAHDFIKKNIGMKPSDIEIFATDVSKYSIEHCKIGQYSNLAVNRGLEERWRQQYFVQQGNLWEVSSTLKDMVTFDQLNLLSSFMSVRQVDMICCRNVLIYFDDEVRQDIVSRMSRLLPKDGILMVGASESIGLSNKDYETHQSGRTAYYTLK